MRRRTSAGAGGSDDTGSSPLTPGVVGVRASTTVLSGRTPCGLSHASARSSSRSSASVTAPGSPRHDAGEVGGAGLADDDEGI